MRRVRIGRETTRLGPDLPLDGQATSHMEMGNASLSE